MIPFFLPSARRRSALYPNVTVPKTIIQTAGFTAPTMRVGLVPTYGIVTFSPTNNIAGLGLLGAKDWEKVLDLPTMTDNMREVAGYKTFFYVLSDASADSDGVMKGAITKFNAIDGSVVWSRKLYNTYPYQTNNFADADYGSAHVRQFLSAGDLGILHVGSGPAGAIMTLLDHNGNLLFTQITNDSGSEDAANAFVSSDAAYIAHQCISNLTVYKINSAGTMLWGIRYASGSNLSDPGVYTGPRVVLYNGFLYVGIYGAHPATGKAGWVILKINPADGSLVSAKRIYMATSTDNFQYHFAMNVDEKGIVIGAAALIGPTDPYVVLIKTDLAMTTVQAQTKLGKTSFNLNLDQILRVQNGYLVSGCRSGSPNGGYIETVDFTLTGNDTAAFSGTISIESVSITTTTDVSIYSNGALAAALTPAVTAGTANTYSNTW